MRAFTFLRVLADGSTTLALSEDMIPVDILRFNPDPRLSWPSAKIRFPDGQVVWVNTESLYKDSGKFSNSRKITRKELNEFRITQLGKQSKSKDIPK